MSVLQVNEMESLFAGQREIAARLLTILGATPPNDSVYQELLRASNNAADARKKLERLIYILKVEEINARIAEEQAKKTALEAELSKK